MTPLAIDLDDVLAARERIAWRVHRTPVATSRRIDERAGRNLFFKCENLQRTGSFKIRGATNRIHALTEEERLHGVVAFSSGNHAQAVALAAAEAGVDATIVMPDDAPRAKLAATRGYGARVELYDRREAKREEIGRRIVEEEGRVLVPPFDDPWIMAGQGTAALELVEEIEGLDAIVVPVGGAGLLSGTATVARGIEPPVRAFGAEPAVADDVVRSLEEGRIVRIDPPDTIADGARTESPGELTLPVVRERAEGVVRVSEEAIPRAMVLLLTRAKLLVEPTGALGLAAVLEGSIPEECERVGVILSGGNVDLSTLADLVGDLEV